MKEVYRKTFYALRHLEILNEIFGDKRSFECLLDWQLYTENYEKLTHIMKDVDFYNQLYDQKGRQMILADLIEYIFLGRGYYFATKNRDKIKELLRILLYLVNLLMCYETITVEENLRRKFLKKLSANINSIDNEELFDTLHNFKGKVGLPEKDSDADKTLNRYFDTMLPKTAGGLWHELLVFAFLIRHDLGYVVPLLLSQRLMSGSETIVPPDFLLITRDKNTYGIEVGMKKEIQSGSFSLITGVPTATIDTINSRSSDRCPICKKWIMFCDQIVDDFSDLDKQIGLKAEIRCLEKCRKFTEKEIIGGKCPYTKYSRARAKTLKYTHHQFADGLHYHYQCVLTKLPKEKSKILKESKDIKAIKTHYPYYAGLEMLFRNK